MAYAVRTTCTCYAVSEAPKPESKSRTDIASPCGVDIVSRDFEKEVDTVSVMCCLRSSQEGEAECQRQSKQGLVSRPR